MTSVQIGQESAFSSAKRSRPDARAIDVHALSLYAQAAQNPSQLKSVLIRTLRAAGVEFLQLTTYRRSQFASVIWSELPDQPVARCEAKPLPDIFACRAIASGTPEWWTLEPSDIQTCDEMDWRSTLNDSGISSGITAAIHASHDSQHVFHFGLPREARPFDSDRAKLSIFATIGFIVTQRLLTWQRQQPSAPSTDAQLSQRELEVIEWCKDGKSYPEIAQILGISTKTVEFHIANAMRKLGVNQKISAIVEAVRRGLIEI